MSERARKIKYELTYNPIREYFAEIKAGKTVSLKVYKVYKELVRIMDDPGSEWEYNAKKANHALEFIENYCRHSKGRYGGKRFRLELWQKALVAATFGFVHKITGLRKHRQVMLVVGRKNGKSTLAAAIGLYLQIADGELGAEIYACATKKDQAKIIWLEAKKMVKKSPTLLRRIKPKVAELEADYFIVEVLPGDMFLLCSDGLYGEVSDEKIAQIILEKQTAQHACEKLILSANENGGGDNITVILVRNGEMNHE